MSRLRGLTTEQLCAELNLSHDRLQALAYSAPNRYQERALEDGDKQRILLVPDSTLRRFQRRFYRRFLRGYPFPEPVYCHRGKGALAAARVHRKHPYLLHFDIADFFPSVDVHRVRDALRATGVEPGLVKTLTRLVTVENQLPQGAPTSTAIGNLVLGELDARLASACRASGAGFAYTRYVDDIAISGGSRLERFVGSIRGIIRDCGWKLNEKGGLLGPDDEHRLLGVCVYVEVTIDDQYLDDLTSTLKAAAEGSLILTESEWASLRGKVGWVSSVDPVRGGELQVLLDKAKFGLTTA